MLYNDIFHLDLLCNCYTVFVTVRTTEVNFIIPRLIKITLVLNDKKYKKNHEKTYLRTKNLKKIKHEFIPTVIIFIKHDVFATQ